MARVIELDPRLGVYVDKKHALIAPGQGNQEIGMGLDLINRSKAADDVRRNSDDVLRPHLGYNFSEFVLHGTISGKPFNEDLEASLKEANKILTRTENAQPAILIDSDERAEALDEFGYFDEPLGSRPYFFAGNSLGFLTALRRAGSISRENLAQLGKGRGDAFKYAREHSDQDTTMMAVDTELSIVQEATERFKLAICLINTDRQIMLGGPIEDINKVLNYLKNEKGVRRAMSFEGIVDMAFHSDYMAPAEPLYRQVVYDIQIDSPRNGLLIGASRKAKVLLTPDEIREELISQIRWTENWRDAMYFLRNQGVDMMTELNRVPRLTNMNIEMFGGERPVRLATPSSEEGDRGVTIGQRWLAKAA